MLGAHYASIAVAGIESEHLGHSCYKYEYYLGSLLDVE